MSNEWVTAPVWRDWRALMRTLYCARIAFDAEINKWRHPSLSITGDVKLGFSDGDSQYETDLADHIATLSDGSFFYSMIFLRAVSIMENHAKLVLFIMNEKKWDIFNRGIRDDEYIQIDALELKGGIEAWGTKLLAGVGQSWDRVYKEKNGMMEVMFLRNAIAHGYSRMTTDVFNKIKAVSPGTALKEHSEIIITHNMLREYTGRIKSLLRILCDGVCHTSKV